jgi:hypothetical protein
MNIGQVWLQAKSGLDGSVTQGASRRSRFDRDIEEIMCMTGGAIGQRKCRIRLNRFVEEIDRIKKSLLWANNMPTQFCSGNKSLSL